MSEAKRTELRRVDGKLKSETTNSGGGREGERTADIHLWVVLEDIVARGLERSVRDGVLPRGRERARHVALLQAEARPNIETRRVVVRIAARLLLIQRRIDRARLRESKEKWGWRNK